MIRTTQTAWARVFARTLRDAGVSLLVSSPGSRSTPYLAAALAEGLEVVDVVDERAAAFVALGYARACGVPAAVLCTSGTAPGHFFPAVIEASAACVPLVLLSADRPTELVHSGAAQTTDQTNLFGRHVRFFADPGDPRADEGALAGLRRIVAQAVSLACGPVAGPVHLNLRARKPLEPRVAETAEEKAFDRAVATVLKRPVARTSGTITFDSSCLSFVAAALADSRRPLFVAGPMPAHTDAAALLGLVRRVGGVLSAESTSQLRFTAGTSRLDTLDAWLSAGLWRDTRGGPSAPDLVVEIGGPPTSGAYERWVSETTPRRIVLGARGVYDPHASAEAIVLGDPSAIARALLEAMPAHTRAEASFREACEELEQIGWRAVAAVASAWGEAQVARICVEATPEDAFFLVGNSLPIRMLDRYAAPEMRRAPLRVLHQRGVNGIDGFVSQAFGAALGGRAPVVALVGDITLLHDIGALAAARRTTEPLVLVVIGNGGGRIFETLPVASDAPWLLPHVVMSEPIDHEKIAEAFGIRFARVERGDELREVIARGSRTPGVTLVCATVPPTSARDADAALRRMLKVPTTMP